MAEGLTREDKLQMYIAHFDAQRVNNCIYDSEEYWNFVVSFVGKTREQLQAYWGTAMAASATWTAEESAAIIASHQRVEGLYDLDSVDYWNSVAESVPGKTIEQVREYWEIRRHIGFMYQPEGGLPVAFVLPSAGPPPGCPQQ